ncbi:unnamed protein product [Nezara viridula]|uniref:Uncharacterized protein n=1 Tax=Nezara viridula TaxID=85310 RepID=A0A9P0HJX7_NEZVI|nr:unnamed protein product [Nezara viridula]
MENIFEEDSDQENFQNINAPEEINFQGFPMIESEIGAGDCRPAITEVTVIENQTEEEDLSTSTILLRSRWFYYALLLGILSFLISFDANFITEDGQMFEVPFLEQMIRCNERRYELIHNLNVIHTALKRCTLEDSKKDEAGKMLTLLHSLYEKHILDLEDFTRKIPKSCKNIGKKNVPS